jgi:hypothetical protein
MPRLWFIGCMVVGLVVSAGLVQAADKPITVTVNGQAQPFTPPAIARDGKAYLPMRPFASAIMGGLSYDAATGTVKISYCSHAAKIKKSQGIIVNGSFYVPLRTVADALAIRITWNARRAQVNIDLGGG